MPAKGQAPGNSNHLSAEPPLCQRERSTSAPNVSFNLVNLGAISGGLVAETLYAEQLQLHKGAHALPLGTESMRMSFHHLIVYLGIILIFYHQPHTIR